MTKGVPSVSVIRPRATILFLTALLAVVVPVFPGAVADWSPFGGFVPNALNSGLYLDSEALSATVTLHAYAKDSSAGMHLLRCHLPTATCRDSLLGMASDIVAYPKIQRITDNHAIMCWLSHPSGVPNAMVFSRTDDAGVSWTIPIVAVSASSPYDNAGSCDELPNGTLVATQAVTNSYYSAGAGVYQAFSYDGGGTWTSSRYTTIANSVTSAAVIASSNTNWTVVANGNGGPALVCHTSNFGASYTCVSPSTTYGTLFKRDTRTSAYGTITSGTTSHIVKTTDPFTLFTSTGVSTPVGVNSISAARLGQNVSIAVTWTRTAGSVTYTHCEYYSSKDDGGTWTQDVVQNRTGQGALSYASVTLTRTTGKPVYECVSTVDGGTNVRGDVFTFASSIPGSASASVPGLVGFDVDEEGTFVLARNNTGFARAFTANALTNTGNLDTRCNRVDGVQATPVVLAFLTCDADTADSHYVTFRHADMAPISAKELFDGACDFCETTIDLTKFSESEVHLNSREIHEMAAFPFSFNHCPTACDTFLNGRTRAAAAWAWSASNGKVGVATYTNIKNSPDAHWRFAAATFGAYTPDEICTFFVHDDNFVAAAGQGQSTKLWKVTYAQDTDGQVTPYMESYAGSLPAARGIACASDGRFLLTGQEGSSWVVHAYDAANGTSLWTRNLTAPGGKRGVAVSWDGRWYAALEGRSILVGSLANGSVNAHVGIPTGSFNNVKLGPHGDDLWVATDAYVNRTLLAGVPGEAGGCVTNCKPTLFKVAPGLTPGGSDAAVATFARGKGVLGRIIPGAGNPGVELFLSLLTILGAAAIAVRLTGGRFLHPEPNVVGAAGFAGMCFSVAFWNFPFWIPLLTGVVAAGLVLRRFVH